MAADVTQLALTGHVNGYNHYRYDTLDAATDVDADGYFNNTDDTQILKVGDIIEVVVWATAIRTGTISDVAKHIVMIVGADGDVDLSDDFYGATIGNAD